MAFLLEEQGFISARQLAGLLSLSVRTIYDRRRDGGDLPPLYDIGGRIRFRTDEVAEWLDARREGGERS